MGGGPFAFLDPMPPKPPPTDPLDELTRRARKEPEIPRAVHLGKEPTLVKGFPGPVAPGTRLPLPPAKPGDPNYKKGA